MDGGSGGEMNLREYIAEALAPLETDGIPVCHRHWIPRGNGDETPRAYITYFEALRQNELMADDEPTTIGRYVQADIWTSEEAEGIARRVRDLMKEAGFMARGEEEIEPEREDTGLGTMHVVSRWVYYEEV